MLREHIPRKALRKHIPRRLRELLPMITLRVDIPKMMLSISSTKSSRRKLAMVEITTSVRSSSIS